jgi:catechol 2,3-dioxygenase-like lactoylglutathione lyase family enzyme
MKIIPLLRVKDINEAVKFYTGILDFELKYPDFPLNEFCVDLINGDAEFQLSSMDGIFGVAISVRIEDVDGLFDKYKKRGLVTPQKENSPVHESPIDQSWGMREFYVTDADGNTLRFISPIKSN